MSFVEIYWINLEEEKKYSKVLIVTKYTLTKFDIFKSYIKNTYHFWVCRKKKFVVKFNQLITTLIIFEP